MTMRTPSPAWTIAVPAIAAAVFISAADSRELRSSPEHTGQRRDLVKETTNGAAATKPQSARQDTYDPARRRD
jgi:hypothetical protein